jgi:hypothetical protein
LSAAEEEASQRGAEVAGGNIAAREVVGDFLGGLLTGEACASLRAWKAQRYGWPARRGMRQRRPSTKVKEHKEERSLERVVDMEVSRKKI